MDQTANEIEAHIDRTRERLGSNLRELEDKVQAGTDWREHFRQRPQLFLGAAFVGGALLAASLRGAPSSSEPRQARDIVGGDRTMQAQAWDLWSNVQEALFGVAAWRLREYIGEFIPGFDDHYRRAEQRAASFSER